MNIDEVFKEVEELISKTTRKFYSQYFEEYFTPLVEFSNIEDIKEDNTSKQKYIIQWEKEKL
jgi:hypothetical protein